MAKRLMDWIAVYKNGEVLKETEKDFEDIEKYRVEEFILKGDRSKFTHFTDTGVCKVNESEFMFSFNGRQLGLSKDIINFKEKVSGWKGKDYIIGYYTGWKERDENGNSIELLFWVDMMEQKIKLRFKFVPIKKTNVFSLNINGQTKNIKIETEKLNEQNVISMNLTNGQKQNK